MKINLPSTFILNVGMLGLRWLCMHLWLNLINWTIDIQENLNFFEIYKVNGEFSCDVTDFGRVPSREGDIQNFALLVLLNRFSKSAQTFTVGFLKLLSTHPIHIVAWGNFPFNSQKHLWHPVLCSWCDLSNSGNLLQLSTTCCNFARYSQKRLYNFIPFLLSFWTSLDSWL